MLFVFTRGEIDRRKLAGRDFAIDGHGKGRADEWARFPGTPPDWGRANFLPTPFFCWH
jgi:hypothetical protein